MTSRDQGNSAQYRQRRGAYAVSICVEYLKGREEHWVIADLVGKGRHVRTVPMPAWVKNAVDEWTSAAEISEGIIFRRISKEGKVWGPGITSKAIWHVVKSAAKRGGLTNLAPHDLRRTCARLCHLSGGELEQIQFLFRSCFYTNHRAVSWLQTEAPTCRQ